MSFATPTRFVSPSAAAKLLGMSLDDFRRNWLTRLIRAGVRTVRSPRFGCNMVIGIDRRAIQTQAAVKKKAKRAQAKQNRELGQG